MRYYEIQNGDGTNPITSEVTAVAEKNKCVQAISDMWYLQIFCELHAENKLSDEDLLSMYGNS